MKIRVAVVSLLLLFNCISRPDEKWTRMIVTEVVVTPGFVTIHGVGIGGGVGSGMYITMVTKTPIGRKVKIPINTDVIVITDRSEPAAELLEVLRFDLQPCGCYSACNPSASRCF